MQTYLCHTEAISKSTRQLIMFLCILFLLFFYINSLMIYFYVYSKYVFMLLTDIPVYLVLYTFGTYLNFVFVFMDICLVFFFVVYIHQPTQPCVLIITMCLFFLMSHVMC